jgi:hypothetical protein
MQFVCLESGSWSNDEGHCPLKYRKIYRASGRVRSRACDPLPNRFLLVGNSDSGVEGGGRCAGDGGGGGGVRAGRRHNTEQRISVGSEGGLQCLNSLGDVSCVRVGKQLLSCAT